MAKTMEPSMPTVSVWRRAGALLVDWAVCLLLLTPTAMIAGLVDAVTPIPTGWIDVGYLIAFSVLILTYFAVSYHRRATLGMRLVSTRLVDAISGDASTWGRALLRGLLAFLFLATWFWVFNVFFFSDARLDGRTAVNWATDLTALGLFLASLLTRLWMLVDRQQRTLIDRLLGQRVTSTAAGPRSRPSCSTASSSSSEVHDAL